MLEAIQIDLQKTDDPKLDVYAFLARERPFVESGVLLQDSLNHPFTDIKIHYRTNGRQYALMSELSLVSSLFWLPQNVLRALLPNPRAIRRDISFEADKLDPYTYRAIKKTGQVDYKVELELHQKGLSRYVETQIPREEDKLALLKISFGYECGLDLFIDHDLNLTKLSAPKRIIKPVGVELEQLLDADKVEKVEEVDDGFIPRSKNYFLDARSRQIFNREFLSYLMLVKRYMGEIRRETSKLQYQGLLETKVEPVEGFKFEELFYVKNDGLIVVPAHPNYEKLTTIPHAGFIHSPKTLLQS